MNWRLFGWQGFAFRTPEDWELAAQQGSPRRGYLRLNDSGGPRMELKWERKLRPPSFENMERAYRRGLRKARGLEGIEPRGGAEGSSGAIKWRRYRWQGKAVFDDALVCCGETRRAAVIRLYSASRRRGDEVMRGVLGEFEDLLAGEHTVWTAYGFACRVPRGFELGRADLRAGFLLLRYRRRREQLEFQRLRVGTVPESRRDSEAWRSRMMGRCWKETGTFSHGGHEGRRLGARGLRPAARLRRPLVKPMGDAWTWRCPETESLYLVKSSRGGAEAAGEWRVWCHEAPERPGSEGRR